MKQLLFYCFAVYFLIGCKKNDSKPFQSYLRMTIDGTRLVTADQEISANNPRTGTLLHLYGRWSTGSLSIDLNPYDNSLGEKMIVANPGSVITPRFSLYEPGQTLYYAGDNGVFGTVTGSGKINILEISNEYVKGTFQFISGPNNNVIRTVTNGEFHIKRDP